LIILFYKPIANSEKAARKLAKEEADSSQCDLGILIGSCKKEKLKNFPRQILKPLHCAVVFLKCRYQG